MSTKAKDLLRKADMALSDLATGGLMNPEQSDSFIRILTQDTALLDDVRMMSMARPKMTVNKLDLATRALRVANQGLITSPLAGEEGTRALARADRTKITTSKVELDTYEVIAEVNLPYEVLEDNIEGGTIDQTRFQATVLDKLAERIRIDIEDVMLNGDTNSGDAFLAERDGVLKQAVSHIVNNGGAALDAVTFNEMIQTLPDKFKRVINRYKFYVSHNKRLQYMMQVAQRQTGLGDAVLIGGDGTNFAPFGTPLKGAASMPSNSALMLDPTNILFGVQRNMRMEFDRDTRERVLIIVFTMRFDFKLEQEDMVVKAINLG
jgi:HK97 family phage major capsid protein